MPPTSAGRLPADLLLCGHHYVRARAALAAAGAVVLDETGAVVEYGAGEHGKDRHVPAHPVPPP